MIQVDTLPVTVAFQRAAEAVAEQYRTLPASTTERAIALLALWAADAIAAGRLAPKDADAAFVKLYVDVGNPPAGPALSDDTDELLMEAITLDDWGTEFSADLDEMRRLAFEILGGAPSGKA